MNSKKRLIAPILIFLAIVALTISGWLWYDNNVDRSGWVEKDSIRYYRDFHADPVSGWLELADGQYYFHDDGTPHTGWQEIDGVTYYFGDSGIMHTGWLEIDGEIHYFAGNGTMVVGWLWLEEGRYYLRDGALLTGWLDADGQRYYFGEDGLMVMGLTEIDGSRYYFDGDGAMVTGLTAIEDKHYYFRDDGTMAADTAVSIEDKDYYFRDDGTMVTGWLESEDGRRYYQPDGAMSTGWAEIDGKRYYFRETGLMHSGWLEQGEYAYYLQEDGSAAVGPTEIDGATHYFSPKGIEVILVNALNPVPAYYQRNLVNVVDYHDVDQRCYDALVQMLDDCVAAGNKYTFNSGYRTIEEQTEILEKRTQEHMQKYNLDFDEAREKALETVAIPGTSEHHLGLAVDLLGDEAIAWLTEHCWDYGFIVRYTEEKEPITGIIDEPWHFRYVGTEVSLDMKGSGLCLEEYLGAPAVKGGGTSSVSTAAG